MALRLLRMTLLILVVGGINISQLRSFQQCCQKDCGAGTMTSWGHRSMTGLGTCACHIAECSNYTEDGMYDDCYGNYPCDTTYNDVLALEDDPNDCSGTHEHFANDHLCYQ